MILGDDPGIECLSAYCGRSHQAPPIDTLADQGMRFIHCFSNPGFEKVSGADFFS
ncbi:hypothetical protein RISK_000689 [Rhodopirellula islandica]|uniref:Uncharacterized protein n=1 Tax=Rhodopirellula islandica TaxID=595434 RepID=A0A0J1BM55_RHOIS|nr:hypothetical protein RISK_000689 [Rhodopirellula islandica]